MKSRPPEHPAGGDDIQCDLCLLGKNLLQAGKAGQAVLFFELGLALNQRQRVGSEVGGDVVALGVDPFLREFLLEVGNIAQIEQLRTAGVAVGAVALEADHLVGHAGEHLLHSGLAGHEGLVDVHVESVPYSTGYYTVDLTFYYRVIADASVQGGRPSTVTGLAVFSKRLVLFGGDASSRSFSSRAAGSCLCKQSIQAGSVPEGVVEVIDPMILGSRIQELCNCGCNCCPPSPPTIPEAILACFEEPLVLDGENKRLLVTIGQFSIARLERSTQLLIPTFDYCVPTKSCPNVGSSSSESPCEVFGQIEFPMDAFFPTKADSCIPAKDSCTNCSRTAK